MELTLREVGKRVLANRPTWEELPQVPTEYKSRLVALVDLIAWLRAQVDRDVLGDPTTPRTEREAPTRLIKQLAKLARLSAWVDGLQEVDDDTYALVERVATDTATGYHLDLIGALMKCDGAATVSDLVDVTGLEPASVNRRIKDLVVLQAVSRVGQRASTGGTGRPSNLYRLAEEVGGLWLAAKGSKTWKGKKTKTTRKLKRRQNPA